MKLKMTPVTQTSTHGGARIARMKQRHDDIARMLADGHSAAEVAGQIGVKRSSLVNYARAKELHYPRNHRWLANNADKLIEMHASGMTSADIAAYVGKSEKAVRQHLIQLGITGRRNDNLVARNDEIVRLIQSGMSLRRTAQILGLKYHSVRSYASRVGLYVQTTAARKIELRVPPALYSALVRKAGHRPVETWLVDRLAEIVSEA